MSLTVHVNLLDTDPADPWKDDADAIALVHYDSPRCPHCTAIDTNRQSIMELVDKANTLAPSLVELERSMLRIQGEFRMIRSDLSRAVRSLRQGILQHQRCAVCLILVGDNHVVDDLVKEPFGNALVCEPCYRTLKKTNQTAKMAADRGDQDD